MGIVSGLRMKKKIIIWSWLLTVLISGLLLAGIFLPAFLAGKNRSLASFIFSLYSPLCHQRPERSYDLWGQQLSVCSRCLGIYAGFFFSAFLYPVYKRSWKIKIGQNFRWLIVLALPLAADFLAGWLKIWDSPLFFKTLTGFFWAAVWPFFWFKALEEFLSSVRNVASAGKVE